MTSAFTAFDAPYRPIRAGLFQHDPPALLGSVCPDCSTRVFPARDFCPHCHTHTAPESCVLSNQGAVFAFTIIHQAPAGRATPYVLALVDLEDRVRVMAQVNAAPQSIFIGQPISLMFTQVGTDEGMPIVGYVVVPQDCREGNS
ncbi:hypothetical protein C7T35_23030 [Variovorax sp. WS11]|uniref:Zn-ribbon domain-containing OB-fold protein n=1 Tax=Variovorax sp. WS11 TaxID=1105204 RepID=UPI000D0DAA57|nr:OB-fold domain-containing protein [Variovorax sp. WS11]NDZ17574.1 hypothetical protein [Variovorax sp. WS11]PSL82221.1 hypothetical protein C7T35_23030 [Variovorax sp. WS11]